MTTFIRNHGISVDEIFNIFTFGTLLAALVCAHLFLPRQGGKPMTDDELDAHQAEITNEHGQIPGDW
jgi:hypothetical protein